MDEKKINFVIYDFETSGRSPRFDQILQAGIIIYDSKLEEVEKVNLRSRINPDIIPSINALKVNRLTISDLLCQKDSSYEMTTKLQKIFSKHSPAIFCGYNSISFDEEFLRQGLWETFFYPYLTTSNNNLRGDILNLTRMVHAFDPKCFNVEKNDEGKFGFKLEDLSRINNFQINNSHEAISDVMATKNILEIIKNNSINLFNVFMENTCKQKLGSKIRNDNFFTLYASYYGKHFIYLLTYLIDHPIYKDNLLAFDLKFEPEEIVKLPLEDLRKVFYSKNKKFFRKIKINKQPQILNFKHALSVEPYHNISERNLKKKLKILNDDELKKKIKKILEEEAESYNTNKSQEVLFDEDTIYSQNFPFTDKLLMEDYNHVDWSKRWVIAEKFKDKRLRYFSAKHIFRTHPNILPQKIFIYLHQKISERLNTIEKRDFTTIPAAIQEADELGLDLERDDNHFQKNQLEQYNIYIDFLNDYYSYKNKSPKPINFNGDLSKKLYNK